jgi:predicted secreted protein with PEFG-CTERM motif
MTAAPSAFAEHSMNATVENAQGSSTPGCEPDCFIPATVTIGVGGMVTFSNNDTAAHTSTAGTPADGPSGAWDSSLVMMNSAYTTPALDAGEYPYFCMVHPWMEGLVIVEEESHDDHGDGHAEEAEDHGDMKMEMQTLTAADISIDIADGAKAGEQVAIDVTISGEHVNYDIVATHNGETILDESGNHSHTGEGSHTTSALSADASDDNPIDVTVTFQGFGIPGDEFTGPIGLTNTAQAVPEFGAIAAVILAVAIVSIIAVSAKSRLSFMPRI